MTEAEIGVPYTAQVTTTGGALPCTWSVSAGALPAGLTLNDATGVISGTPTTSGQTTFEVRVSDSSPTSSTATMSFRITVAPALRLTTTSFPGGTVGVSSSMTLSASGGITPYAWSVGSGQLPIGLTLGSQTGMISGTPVQAGTFTFTVKVSDSVGASSSVRFSSTIASLPSLQITTTDLPRGQAGTSYSASLNAAGGVLPYTWSSTGILPTGISLRASGQLSGTATSSGTFPITFTLTDSSTLHQSESIQLPLTIIAAASSSRQATVAPIIGLTIHPQILGGMPWPSATFASIRLWDTYTRWADLVPSPGVYDWSRLDLWLDLAQEHGLDVLYTLGGTPTWASSNPSAQCAYNPGSCYPPSNLQDWDDYVRAIATHAAGRIRYWEIWNEANARIYWNGDVATLLTLTQSAASIIKSIDPNAEIFSPSGTGGAAGTSTFLDQFLAVGGGVYIDGIAFHGYVKSVPSSPEEINGIVDALRSVMAKWGQSEKPLWDTEGSWGTSNQLSSQDDRVAFVARHYILQLSKGVQRFYWYAWNNTNWGTLWDMSTNTLLPAGVAYQQLNRWFVGATLSTPCSMASDSTWTCGLTKPNGARALAIWNTAGTKQYNPSTSYVLSLDLSANINPVSESVTIGAKPILLITARY